MAKTLIDIDEEMLERARQALGTTTKKDTVNAALAEAARRVAGDREMDRFRAGVYDDLLDPEIMRRAWQH